VTDTILSAEAASDRAGALEEADDIEGAIQAMTEAIELAPESPFIERYGGICIPYKKSGERPSATLIGCLQRSRTPRAWTTPWTSACSQP
jgi:hypothetical protein